MSLIEAFPQPLLDDIVRDRCIPIVGAGFSLNSILPPGREMPLWNRLGELLASELKGYPQSSPVDVISAYSHEFGRSRLIEKLGDLLCVDMAKPGSAHQAFCQCHFDTVVTTNFDFLLEGAYRQVEKSCNPIIEEEQLSIRGKDQHVSLLKLHGDLHHPSRLVATEEDYDTFLDRYPLLATFLANLLIVRTPLLVGYSLEDPDFRHIWQLIGDRLGGLRRPAYVLAVGARQSDIARFERRGVKVINYHGTKEQYSGILTSVFNELRDYWSKKLPSLSTVVDDNTAADLTLPVDTISRLCYFSVPTHLLSYYRSFVFPLAVRHGLTPMSDDDVISPGESLSAKVAAILARAEVAVVDADNRWALYELKRTTGKKRVLVIGTAEPTTPTDPSWTFLDRPKSQYWESDHFAVSIDAWFESVSRDIQPRLDEEPLRLLRAGENRAAVISAFGLFEFYLRKSLETIGREDFVPTQKLVTYAVGGQLIDKAFEKEIRLWMRTRNRVVHEGATVERREARRMVEGIVEVINQLRFGKRETAVTVEEIPL